MLTGNKSLGHSKNDKGVTIETDSGLIDVEKVVISVGRRPFADLLQLSNANLATDQAGYIPVDDFCRTKQSGIYAVGDLVNLAPTSTCGICRSNHGGKGHLGEIVSPIDHDKVPNIYCHPEVAFAGLSEEKAKDLGYDILVSKHRFSGNGRAMIIGETDGLVSNCGENRRWITR